MITLNNNQNFTLPKSSILVLSDVDTREVRDLGGKLISILNQTDSGGTYGGLNMSIIKTHPEGVAYRISNAANLDFTKLNNNNNIIKLEIIENSNITIHNHNNCKVMIANGSTINFSDNGVNYSLSAPSDEYFNISGLKELTDTVESMLGADKYVLEDFTKADEELLISFIGQNPNLDNTVQGEKFLKVCGINGSYLNALPPEIILHITSFISLSDIRLGDRDSTESDIISEGNITLTNPMRNIDLDLVGDLPQDI